MKPIPAALLRQTIAALCVQAVVELPQDVLAALEQARAREVDELPRSVMNALCDNALVARESRLPLCQDTGMIVIFVDWGQSVLCDGDVNDALMAGVADAAHDGWLRASVVSDPLRRNNSGDNTPPVVHLRFVPGDRVTLTVMPKGFGSENMSSLAMLAPHASAESLVAHVVDVVARAGANPCPPLVVGVGVGGTAELCCLNAKRALLRDIGTPHTDPLYDALEREMLAAVNELSIGPQGMGGLTTALAVFVEAAPTHIAGLPVACCLGCHSARKASAAMVCRDGAWTTQSI